MRLKISTTERSQNAKALGCLSEIVNDCKEKALLIGIFDMNVAQGNILFVSTISGEIRGLHHPSKPARVHPGQSKLDGYVSFGEALNAFSTAEANKLLLEQGVKLSNPSQSVKHNLDAKKIFKQNGANRISRPGLEHLEQLASGGVVK